MNIYNQIDYWRSQASQAESEGLEQKELDALKIVDALIDYNCRT